MTTVGQRQLTAAVVGRAPSIAASASVALENTNRLTRITDELQNQIAVLVERTQTLERDNRFLREAFDERNRSLTERVHALEGGVAAHVLDMQQKASDWNRRFVANENEMLTIASGPDSLQDLKARLKSLKAFCRTAIPEMIKTHGGEIIARVDALAERVDTADIKPRVDIEALAECVDGTNNQLQNVQIDVDYVYQMLDWIAQGKRLKPATDTETVKLVQDPELPRRSSRIRKTITKKK